MPDLILSPPRSLGCWLRLYLLYRSTFPRAERKPFPIILKKFRAGTTDIWCLYRQGKFIGFAATNNSPSIVMLDYLVVKKAFRGQGIGSGAMVWLLDQYADRELVLEIENPYTPGPDQALREKRRQFYIRCGMEPLNIMAEVFGVPFELLGRGCRNMTFDRYRNFYRDFYRPQAAEEIFPMEHPNAGQ